MDLISQSNAFICMYLPLNVWSLKVYLSFFSRASKLLCKNKQQRKNTINKEVQTVLTMSARSVNVWSYQGAEQGAFTMGYRGWSYSTIPMVRWLQWGLLGIWCWIAMLQCPPSHDYPCDLPCQLPISKIKGEASKRSQMVIRWLHNAAIIYLVDTWWCYISPVITVLMQSSTLATLFGSSSHAFQGVPQEAD